MLTCYSFQYNYVASLASSVWTLNTCTRVLTVLLDSVLDSYVLDRVLESYVPDCVL